MPLYFLNSHPASAGEHFGYFRIRPPEPFSAGLFRREFILLTRRISFCMLPDWLWPCLGRSAISRLAFPCGCVTANLKCRLTRPCVSLPVLGFRVSLDRSRYSLPLQLRPSDKLRGLDLSRHLGRVGPSGRCLPCRLLSVAAGSPSNFSSFEIISTPCTCACVCVRGAMPLALERFGLSRLAHSWPST
jgi:hypothetical protein